MPESTERPFWQSAAFWITIAFLPMLYMVVYRVLWATAPDGTQLFSTDMQSVVITSIIVGLLGTITGYFMGSSSSNKTKDDTINTLSAKAPAISVPVPVPEKKSDDEPLPEIILK